MQGQPAGRKWSSIPPTVVCGVEHCSPSYFLFWYKVRIHLTSPVPPSLTPCSVPLCAKARKQQWFICSLFNLVLKHVYTWLEQRRGQKWQCHCKDYPDVCLHSVFHMDSPKLLVAIVYFSAFLYTCSYQYLTLRTSLFLFPLLCLQFLIPSAVVVFFLQEQTYWFCGAWHQKGARTKLKQWCSRVCIFHVDLPGLPFYTVRTDCEMINSQTLLCLINSLIPLSCRIL